MTDITVRDPPDGASSRIVTVQYVGETGSQIAQEVVEEDL